jgi:hypothetical protein
MLTIFALFMACTTGGDEGGSFPISSFADDMKACSPDLSSSAINYWSDGADMLHMGS